MPNWSYVDAGSTHNVLQILDITSVPGSLTQGSDWTISIKATAQAEIKDGAYLDITVKLGLIKIISKQYDLFEKLRYGSDDGGWTLSLDTGTGGEPIKKGDVGMTLALKSAGMLPVGKFAISVRGYTVEDDELATLDFKVDLTHQQG